MSCINIWIHSYWIYTRKIRCAFIYKQYSAVECWLVGYDCEWKSPKQPFRVSSLHSQRSARGLEDSGIQTLTWTVFFTSFPPSVTFMSPSWPHSFHGPHLSLTCCTHFLWSACFDRLTDADHYQALMALYQMKLSSALRQCHQKVILKLMAQLQHRDLCETLKTKNNQ